MSASDLEPDTIRLRKTTAVPSGGVPSSLCIAAALIAAASVTSTPMGSKVVATRLVPLSTEMSMEVLS